MREHMPNLYEDFKRNQKDYFEKVEKELDMQIKISDKALARYKKNNSPTANYRTTPTPHGHSHNHDHDDTKCEEA
jgi:hypothetical protein